MFLWTDDDLTHGASPGLVFLVRRKFEGGIMVVDQPKVVGMADRADITVVCV